MSGCGGPLAQADFFGAEDLLILKRTESRSDKGGDEVGSWYTKS